MWLMHRRAHTKFQRPRMILITATFRTIFRIFDETSRKTQPATHSLGAVKKKSKKSHFCITLADIPEKQHNSNDKGVQLGGFWFWAGCGAGTRERAWQGRPASRRSGRGGGWSASATLAPGVELWISSLPSGLRVWDAFEAGDTRGRVF